MDYSTRMFWHLNTHVHFGSNPKLAKIFLSTMVVAKKYKLVAERT